MRIAALFSLFLIIHQSSFGQQFEVDTIQYMGDTDKRINLVLLGDGYRSAELDSFSVHAVRFTATFFQEPVYQAYQNYFNVFAIRTPSNESGASHPGTATDVTEPKHPISTVDNRFGSTFDAFNIHRLLVAENKVEITNVLANNFPAYDQVLILVNSPHYGGSGGRYPTASLHQSSSAIAIHELGHSFVNLRDEYFAGDVYAREGINMTKETDPGEVKWKNWMNVGGVGIYQHCCSGTSASWYRPHQSCLMRVLSANFCPVCVEGTIEKIHRLIVPIDNFSPSESEVIASALPKPFILDLIKPNPNTLKVDWVLNDEILVSNIDTIIIEDYHLNGGTNSLMAVVQDTTVDLKIDEHSSIHLYTVSWSIENSTTAIDISNGNQQQVSIHFSPNPTTSNIRVNWESQLSEERIVQLSDLSGRVLKIVELDASSTFDIDLGDIVAGTYNISFIVNRHLLSTRRVVKF